jgi:hypothetical protein
MVTHVFVRIYGVASYSFFFPRRPDVAIIFALGLRLEFGDVRRLSGCSGTSEYLMDHE